MAITDAEFAVLKSKVDAQELRLQQLESKLEKEIEKLGTELKESNKKLDEIKDMLNQAKGAGQMAKVFWAVMVAAAAGVGYVIKGLPHN